MHISTSLAITLISFATSVAAKSQYVAYRAATSGAFCTYTCPQQDRTGWKLVDSKNLHDSLACYYHFEHDVRHGAYCHYDDLTGRLSEDNNHGYCLKVADKDVCREVAPLK